MRDQIIAIEGEYRRYKTLGEAAMGQVEDVELCLTPKPQPRPPDPSVESDNSIAAIVAHLAGNLESRFMDFLTTDGEKPWRNREEEFVPRTRSRAEILDRWNRGWNAVLTALTELTDAHLSGTITIRNERLRIDAALYRSLAHTSYHVGQIVYIAKSFRGETWKSLSIPKGKSAEFTRTLRDKGANVPDKATNGR